MTQYINKDAIIAEIERIKKEECPTDTYEGRCKLLWFEQFLSSINTLEVKEIGVDLGDPKGDIGVKTVWDSSNSLNISRSGNSHIGENGDLEKAAAGYAREQLRNPDYPTYNDEYEIECAFEAGAQWQKEQMFNKACKWLEDYLLDYWSQINANDTELFIDNFKKAMEE